MDLTLLLCCRDHADVLISIETQDSVQWTNVLASIPGRKSQTYRVRKCLDDSVPGIGTQRTNLADSLGRKPEALAGNKSFCSLHNTGVRGVYFIPGSCT